jgi:N-acetylglucosaminyldiphosphoundecaprenol N-acetyl-beta-D-mannosaminyltransferase
VSSTLTTTRKRGRLRLLETPLTHKDERFLVGGVGVDALRFEETVQRLLAAPRQGRRLRVHFCALHPIVEASKDAALRECLAGADVVAPDGKPLVWLGRLRGKQIERVCGPDAMLALLDRSRVEGGRHFFYGGTANSLGKLAAEMTTRFRGLQIVGLYAPPFRPLTPEETHEVADLINDAEPDYVWVGLGAPKQDYWLETFRPLLDASVLLGVGAAFDFHAGLKKRAPAWAQRLGVEWAFRLISEPRRLAWRYIGGGVWLIRTLLNEKLLRRRHEVSA